MDSQSNKNLVIDETKEFTIEGKIFTYNDIVMNLLLPDAYFGIDVFRAEFSRINALLHPLASNKFLREMNERFTFKELQPEFDALVEINIEWQKKASQLPADERNKLWKGQFSDRA